MKRLILLLAVVTVAAVGCSSDRDAGPASTAASSSVTVTTSTVTVTSSPTAEDSTGEPTEEQSAPAPVDPVQTVAIGDYCSSRGATAATADGATAYCARLAGTDASVWSLSAGVAPNPAIQQQMSGTPSAGDICYDPSASATDAQGRTLNCRLAPGGAHLVWQ